MKGPTQVGNKNINKTRNCPHSLEFISISGAKSPFYLLKKLYSSHFQVKQALRVGSSTISGGGGRSGAGGHERHSC